MSGSVLSEEVAPADASPAPTPAGVTPTPPAPEDGTANPNDEEAQYDATSALIAVEVPESAEVFVNGYRTSSVGSHRQYRVPQLAAGEEYRFQVRAVVQREGRVQEKTEVVSLRGGQRADLTFDLSAPAEEVETVVTLHVPANATVELAGAKTHLQGSTRVFATTSLPRGSSWQNYRIVVTWDKDGQLQTQQRSLTVEGGERYELRFDDAESLVANR